MKTIKIKYHNNNLTKIKKISKGDWIDLRAAENVTMKTGETKLISLGVSMQLPKGYEAHVVPRSSTFKNWGVIGGETVISDDANTTYYLLQTNSKGIIDNSYCGNNDIWKFPAYAMRDTEIKENDRICQFRIMKKQPNIKFIEVDNLDNEDRGGFGSTGTNTVLK